MAATTVAVTTASVLASRASTPIRIVEANSNAARKAVRREPKASAAQ